MSDSGEFVPSTAVLDPDNHWAVASYEQKRDATSMRGRVTYYSDIAGIAFPRRIVEEVVNIAGQVISIHVLIFSRPTFAADKNPMAFTLEAYGLDETRDYWHELVKSTTRPILLVR